jgi:uncharacterized membrane protein (Fun14 family)
MDYELIRQLINILIIALGAVAIGYVLRDVLKVAVKVVRIVVIIFVLAVLLASYMGWIKLPF